MWLCLWMRFLYLNALSLSTWATVIFIIDEGKRLFVLTKAIMNLSSEHHLTRPLIWHYRLITDDKMTSIFRWIIAYARLASFIVPNILHPLSPWSHPGLLGFLPLGVCKYDSTLPTKTALAVWRRKPSLSPRASSSVIFKTALLWVCVGVSRPAYWDSSGFCQEIPRLYE